MDILYLLIPLSAVLVVVVALALLWAIRTGQFDDLVGPMHRVLADDEDRPAEHAGPGAARERDDASQREP